MSIITIVSALLVLCVLVVVHEFGHYIAARLLGIPVVEFAVGFGKKLFSHKGKSTEFTLRLLPLGGFCRFVDSESAKESGLADFRQEKQWKRLIVYFAGAALNIVTAFLLAIVLLMGFGDYDAKIESVNENSPAQIAGLLPGDVLIAIGNKQLAFDFSAMEKIGQVENGKSLNVKVIRDGERKSFELSNLYNEAEGKNMMGVSLVYYSGKRAFTLVESVQASYDFLVFFVKEMFKVIGSIFAQPETVTEQLAGPVALVSVVGEAVRGGIEMALRMIILISVNLGVMNLLPIPGLDGAHILFCVVQMITGKQMSENAEGIISLIGLGLLMSLTVYLTFNDIGRMFGG